MTLTGSVLDTAIGERAAAGIIQDAENACRGFGQLVGVLCVNDTNIDISPSRIDVVEGRRTEKDERFVEG